MSYMTAGPEIVSAGTSLSDIGSDLTAARTAAATHTTGLLAAAEDEVSAAIAAVFSAQGQRFQALGARAAAFHEQFVQALTAAAGSYARAEAANVQTLTPLATDLNQVGNTLADNLFGSAAITPIPASLNPTFAGAPSLASRVETAAFYPFKELLTITGVYNQWGNPNSPLLALLASNAPGLSLILGNSPPKILPLLLGETVQQSTHNGMTVVEITPAHPNGNYVVAIHGGAFILPPTIFHWIDYSMMAYQTGATIEVPIYPLMQQGGTAGVVVPAMAGLISGEIGAHGAPHVSVLGDSAGGTLALAAAEYLVANNQAVPASMVLLSPWLDVSDTNPNIPYVHDPYLPPLGSGAQNIGKVWAGGLPENNYEVSPLYGSLKGLPQTYVYSGSLDAVSPDSLVLQQEAVSQGVPFSFALVNGEFHDWIFLSPDGLHYWQQIDQELGI